MKDPNSIVLVARLRNLQDSLGTMERMFRLPISLTDELQKVVAERAGDALQMDAGVDVAVALSPASTDTDPKFFGAVSIPMANLEGALSQLEKRGNVVHLAPGVYRAKFERPQSEDGESSDSPTSESETPKEYRCDLAASLGNAPARLVCSEDEQALDSLRPWLTRGLPLQPTAKEDLEVHLRFAPLRERYVPVARTHASDYATTAKQWMETILNIRDPKLLMLPERVMHESITFVEDMQEASFFGDFIPETNEISTRVTIAFRSRNSWFTQVYTDANGRSGPPPEIFWRLPKDADNATYASWVDPAHFEGFNDTARSLMSHALELTPLSAQSKSAIDTFIASIPLHKTVAVSARGEARRTTSAGNVTTARDAVREFEQFFQSIIGWTILGMEAPSAPYADHFKKGVATMEQLMHEARKDAHLGPEMRKATWIPQIRWRSPFPGYPQGTTGIEITASFDSKDIWSFANTKPGTPHPPGAAARGSITLHGVVIPNGPNRTWIGISADPKTLQEKSRVVVSGPSQNTLASLADLEPLRQSSTIGGGFIIYGSMVDNMMKTFPQNPSVDMRLVHQSLETMPNQLRTPVLQLHTATAGDTPTNTIELRLQRGTVDDLANLIGFVLSPQGQQLLEQLRKTDIPLDVP